MKRSSKADEIVRHWEGYHRALPDGSCAAYPDVATGGEPWTIGFGTIRYANGTKVKQGDVLSRAAAEKELDAELDRIEDALATAITAPVTQAQWDALCSFCFNLGLVGAAKQIERINARDYEGCAKSFDLYVKANGRVFQGLVNRRNEEEALFRSEPFPGSEPVSVGRPYAPCPVPVPWYAEYERGERGDGAYWIQCALIGLGYLAKPKDGEFVGDVFNEHVQHAVERFQGGMMGLKEMDGIVGPKTRAAIEAAIIRARAPKSEPAEPTTDGVAILRRNVGAGTYDSGPWAGLKPLILMVGAEWFNVVSGARGAQAFRRPTDPRSVPGNLEPIPQGCYRIGSIQFAGGKDNYESSHGAGLGPVWVGLDADFSDDRGAFGFHLDSNVGSSPGSAGCVVFRNVVDLKRFVAALRKYDPKVLSVEWGL